MLSVIVPVRNGAAVLPACLDGLAAQQHAPAHEVIVVDNGSTDGSAAVAARYPLGARVVTETRVGSYAARNAGIAVSTGDVLAFTDADCVPESGWLAAGRAAIEAGADLAAGEIVPTFSANPTMWERYDRAVYLRQAELVDHDGGAATANLFVRRAVVDEVGMFDADLRSSGDIELCRRATSAGFRLVYAPEARVRHASRSTLVGTWRLHRRLGAGWAALARQGKRPSAAKDPALRLPLGTVIDRADAAGDHFRRRAVLPAHAVAMAARWTGRLTGRE